MTPFTPEQKQYIETRWKDTWEGVMQAQGQALNWLMTMNTGGVAGTLAYAASKTATATITVALLFFSVGLISLIGFGVIMFYAEEKTHNDFRGDLRAFYAGAIDWAELIRRDDARPSKYRLCEVLGWISAIAGGLGIVLSAYAIL